MQLNDTQRIEANKLIEKAKHIECANANNLVESALNEWKEGKKNNVEAYNKIFKKVIKNDHYLVKRYTKLNDTKAVQSLAEILSDNILNSNDFENLDTSLKQEIFKIADFKV